MNNIRIPIYQIPYKLLLCNIYLAIPIVLQYRMNMGISTHMK